jgi:hypothetical protein
MRGWAILMAVLSTQAFAGADLKPEDFAYALPVEVSGDAAAYRVPLPVSVYQSSARPDLGDLRVFNGQKEVVPYALERPDAGTSARESTRLPLFHLKDNSAAALDAVRITVESGKAAVNVQAPAGATVGAGSTSYLADARGVSGRIAALILEWPEDAADFAGRLQIEAGDTLGQWSTITASSPVANLHAEGEHLVERRLELPPTEAKFWRLSWVGAEAPFALTGVMAEPARETVDAARASLMVFGRTDAAHAGEFEFDLGARPPVDRVNLELPEVNTTIGVDLLSRSDSKAAWRPVVHAGMYRLKSAGTELRNGPIHIAQDSDRYWRARVDPRGGGLGHGVPRLSVGWVSQNVIFLARGAGPYLIAYGSAVAESAESSLESIPKGVVIGAATAAAPIQFGGAGRLAGTQSSVQWKQALLWAVLIIATGLLGWMAMRLAREMR